MLVYLPGGGSGGRRTPEAVGDPTDRLGGIGQGAVVAVADPLALERSGGASRMGDGGVTGRVSDGGEGSGSLGGANRAFGNRDHGVDVPAEKAPVVPVDRVLDLRGGVVDPQCQGKIGIRLAVDHGGGATGDHRVSRTLVPVVPRRFPRAVPDADALLAADLKAGLAGRRHIPSAIAVNGTESRSRRPGPCRRSSPRARRPRATDGILRASAMSSSAPPGARGMKVRWVPSPSSRPSSPPARSGRRHAPRARSGRGRRGPAAARSRR